MIWLQQIKSENERLAKLLEVKDRRIAALEIQVSQLTRQITEIREENVKLHRALNPQPWNNETYLMDHEKMFK